MTRSRLAQALRTGLRVSIAVPVGFVLAVIAIRLSVWDGPGFGTDSLACAVMLHLDSPLNWRVLASVFASLAALFVFGLDRLLAQWIGGHGPRSSAVMSAVLFLVVGIALGVADVGVFC